MITISDFKFVFKSHSYLIFELCTWENNSYFFEIKLKGFQYFWFWFCKLQIVVDNLFGKEKTNILSHHWKMICLYLYTSIINHNIIITIVHHKTNSKMVELCIEKNLNFGNPQWNKSYTFSLVKTYLFFITLFFTLSKLFNYLKILIAHCPVSSRVVFCSLTFL